MKKKKLNLVFPELQYLSQLFWPYHTLCSKACSFIWKLKQAGLASSTTVSFVLMEDLAGYLTMTIWFKHPNCCQKRRNQVLRQRKLCSLPLLSWIMSTFTANFAVLKFRLTTCLQTQLSRRYQRHWRHSLQLKMKKICQSSNSDQLSTWFLLDT